MPDRQEQFNLLLDELEPAERDIVKQAIRDISTQSMRMPDIESDPEVTAA
jgi:hypothetical protein